MTEHELLRRVAAGDRQAFDELYGRTAPWLTARLRRRCRDDDVVAEVLQDTFLAVWQAAGTYQGSGEVAGWIWSIAGRRLIDAFRKRARTARTPLTTETNEPSAEDTALSGSYDERLGAALHQLSPELRDVLRATVLDGLSIRETSALLGVPENTVKTRARRARIVLREAMSS